MKRMFLVRHGATEWSGTRYCGRTDLPLSALGRRQARRLAERIRQLARGPLTVVSSPLRRARATAATLHAPEPRCLSDADLCEMDFGEAEGATFGELEQRWPPIAAALLAGETCIDWPAGERWSDFDQRVAAAWDRLSAIDGDTAVVTHGGPAGLLLNRALNDDHRYVLHPGEVWILTHDADWQLLERWLA